MMINVRLSGVIPPLVTPVDAQGKFDAAAMRALLKRQIAAGVNGVLVLGSTGEFSQMDVAMRKDILEQVVAEVGGRVPVLAGVGTPSTRETIALARHAKSVGVAAALVVNPYYTPLSETHLLAHYREIADGVDMPLFLYNYPGMTGQDVGPALVREVALTCPNFVGIKDSVEAMSHTQQILLDVKPERPDFMVFSGFDDHLLPNLILGGDGAIPGTANFAPEVTCGLYQAFLRRDYPSMFAAHRQIAALMAIYRVDTPVYGPIKEAIRMTGVSIPRDVLAPARELDTKGRERVAAILKAALPDFAAGLALSASHV
ncbi:dihydrodipicolinate synthase family protein [Telmatospirillum siberiense]|nr:dihydrodipicolinate synthase family protein [Telmatospirillum siberiense]